MPKLLCKCGDVLRFGDIPCEIRWGLVPDADFVRFFEEEPVDAGAIHAASHDLIRCPRCGRLWIFWDDGAQATEYVPVGIPVGIPDRG